MGHVIKLAAGRYMRARRRKLAEELTRLASQIAADNFRKRGWMHTQLEDKYQGQVIIPIGGNRGMWCDPDPARCGLYTGEYWATTDDLKGLGLTELGEARTHLRERLAQK